MLEKCKQVCEWNRGGQCWRSAGAACPLSNMARLDDADRREIAARLYRLEELTQAIAIDLKYMLMEIQQLQKWWLKGPDVPGEGDNGHD